MDIAYEAIVFTMEQFVLPQLTAGRVAFIAPAIDLLATKNMDLPIQQNLVGSVEACAERVHHLLCQPGERGEFGRAGRDHVRRHFLMPRLVRDELRLIKRVLGISWQTIAINDGQGA